MPIEIIPGLYLGNKQCAHDQIFLKSRNINIIINVTNEIPFIKNFDNIQKIRININDKFQNDIDKEKENLEFSYRIPPLLNFIMNKISKGKNILIHCKHGKFRSTTIIICFIMKYMNLKLIDAYKILKIKYPLKKLDEHLFKTCLLKIETDLKSNILYG